MLFVFAPFSLRFSLLALAFDLFTLMLLHNGRISTIGLAPTIPEDLYHLIKKAVSVRKHLDSNRKDFDAKYRLRLIEARIHRLSRHFKVSKVLPPTWKYESKNAAALVA